MPEELDVRFSQGDMDAMAALIDEHKRDLYNLCFRLTFNRQDAEDLFQQTWIKAAKNASRYRPGFFRGWLYRICLNQYADNARRSARRRKMLQENFASTSAKDLVLQTGAAGESLEEQVERRHIQALLVASIDRLPKEQKLPVVLFYYQQMKYADIAGVLQVPEGTVKSRINTAKKKLKATLERELYV